MSEIFGVIGAGTMGNGIAQVAARAGFDVVMRDVGEDFLARGMAAIDKSLQRDVDKDRNRRSCRKDGSLSRARSNY
jgi:3-hydroxybutyryl-CoA dehydrogenase